MPQRGDSNRDLKPGVTSLLQFGQRQIGLGFNPTLKGAIMLGQAGTPIAANLFWKALPRATMFAPKPLDTLTADTKRLQTSPVPSPRFRAAIIRCRRSWLKGRIGVSSCQENTTSHPMRLSK